MTVYDGYEPLSSLDHSKDERDAHRIAWLERELNGARAERDAMLTDDDLSWRSMAFTADAERSEALARLRLAEAALQRRCAQDGDAP